MSETILDRLEAHAGAQPDEAAFRFLSDLAALPEELSFSQLLQAAQAQAQFLSELASPGDRVMLFFPPGLAYIKAFFACLLAGMVAVPLYPPRRNVKSDRIIRVAESCQASVALTTESELAAVRSCWDEQNSLGLPLSLFATDAIAGQPTGRFQRPATDAAAPAFLQYTSGSTGTPKGVVITHENIVANMRHLSLMSTGNKDDVFVNWLPLFHDLGLVTAVLWPVYLGAPSILMAPATFVRDPVIWLQAITRYRGTMCGAPNFAFDLCLAKVADADLAALDLHSWRVAYNAAEPVRGDTLVRFSERFASCGFAAHAFYPSYGMAEATVFITGGEATATPILLDVDRRALAEHRVEPVSPEDPSATVIVGCGTAAAPHDVRIVDPETRIEQPEGRVGEIWFAGPSVSPGYWGLTELSGATFGQTLAGAAHRSGYLKTGDLGVMFQGQLFITGRIKDFIILRGRNYYPQDIELSAVSAHPAVRPGHVAAFALAEQGVEQLVVVAEIEREHFRRLDADAVIGAIRQRIALDHEIRADQVVLLKPFRIPVTSSGKIQRRQTCQLLQAGELECIASSHASVAPPFVAPASATEEALCTVWSAILKRERVGVTDNFYDLGGDSLAAMDMAGQLRLQFPELDLQAGVLLESPTIRQLAAWIDLTTIYQKAKRATSDTAAHATIRI